MVEHENIGSSLENFMMENIDGYKEKVLKHGESLLKKFEMSGGYFPEVVFTHDEIDALRTLIAFHK